MTMRLRWAFYVRGLKRLAEFVILGACVAFSGAALAAPEDGQKFGDWTARCESDPNDPAAGTRCFVFQSVVDTEQDRPVMMFAVSQEPDIRAVIVLPLGVDLRSGIEMTVDEDYAKRHPFIFCIQDGCQSHVKMDESLVGNFKRGLKGSIAFRTLPGGQVVRVPFSLKGFTAALGSLQ